MALLFVFYFNPATKESIENAGIFSEELKSIMQTNHREQGVNNENNYFDWIHGWIGESLSKRALR